MIDTIVIMLPQGSYMIRDHDRFSPSTRGLFEQPFYRLGSRANFSCYQNPTAEQLRQGNYKPRLTTTKRPRKGSYDVSLKIELSLPKMLFGNNFDELTDVDFDTVIMKLQEKLKDMGVWVFDRVLRAAPISAVHYSKNIELTDYTTCSMILNQIAKANMNVRFDLNKTDFRNEGQALRYHANSFELVLYDKLRDLQQAKISEKRSLEKDNVVQLGLFDELTKRRPYEVLRMEMRLGQRRKIRQVLQAIKLDCEPTFANLFSAKVSQAVLLHHWQQIESTLSILSSDMRPAELLEAIRHRNPHVTPRKALMLAGAALVTHDGSERRLRQTLGFVGKKNDRWYALKRDMRKLNLPQNDSYQAVLMVKQALRDFGTMKVAKEKPKEVMKPNYAYYNH